MIARRRRESDESANYREMSEDNPPTEEMLLVNGDDAEAASGVGPDESDFSQAIIMNVQRYANVFAHFLAVSIILVVYWWIHKLGGLAWQAGKSKQVFNWHPLLMITAFAFMTVSSLSFRFPWKSTNRSVTKLVHATGWTVATLSATIGLIAVFRSHNDAVSGYIANMYSLHSWIGSAVILLYVTQFATGVRAFGGPLASSNISQPLRALMLQFHVVAGPLIYFLTAVTILLGIQEKEGFVGCAYHVESKDWFPIQNLGKIPSACLVSHLLGLLVFLTTLSAGIALTDFRSFAQ